MKLRSSDPGTYPELTFNYLETEEDRREWVEGVQAARDILNQPALEPFNGGELSPGPEIETEEQILAWLAKDVETRAAPVAWAPVRMRSSTRPP